MGKVKLEMWLCPAYRTQLSGVQTACCIKELHEYNCTSPSGTLPYIYQASPLSGDCGCCVHICIITSTYLTSPPIPIRHLSSLQQAGNASLDIVGAQVNMYEHTASSSSSIKTQPFGHVQQGSHMAIASGIQKQLFRRKVYIQNLFIFNELVVQALKQICIHSNLLL